VNMNDSARNVMSIIGRKINVGRKRASTVHRRDGRPTAQEAPLHLLQFCCTRQRLKQPSPQGNFITSHNIRQHRIHLRTGGLLTMACKFYFSNTTVCLYVPCSSRLVVSLPPDQASILPELIARVDHAGSIYEFHLRMISTSPDQMDGL
jgi:hypothetical protein